MTCLQDHTDKCKGTVEYRESLSGTGVEIARCEHHWGEALERDEQIRLRYPRNAPSDFDPSYAGESWE
jgi:hypothetical protein